MRRRLLVLIGLVASASLGAGPVAALPTGPRQAEDPERVTFGLGPGGQAFIDKRASLTYTVPPGGEVMDRVAVFNQSNQALSLLLYSADAVNTTGGKLDAEPRAARPDDVGGWVRLGAHATGKEPTGRSLVRVAVPAQSRKKGIGKVVLPLRISVPRDATPGDHAGAVVAGLLARGANPESANLELEQRVALRVYVRVSGEAKPGLAVKVRDVDYTGGGGLGLDGTLRVSYEVRNTGNTRLGARTALSAEGPLGLGSWTATGPAAQELLPGNRAVLTAELTGVWPTIVGSLRVTATATAAPSATAPRLEPVSDTARYWAVTWQEVALLVLLAGGFAYRRWRRARRPEPRHAKGGPAPKELVGAGAVVMLLLLTALSVGQGRAEAAVLGRIDVSPTAGDDEMLFTGVIADAKCPAGTGDSYFSVDGPGLPRDAAFIGAGNAKGTGYQYFRNASIANIRTTNTGAFREGGTYTIRFSCVRFSDGKVVDSYTRGMDYAAGGKGSWRLRGVSASGPTRPPLPGDPYAVNPYAVAPQARTKAAASAVPSVSARPTAAPGSPTATASAVPLRAGAPPTAAVGGADERGFPVALWGSVLGGLLAGVIALAVWQRHRQREESVVRQPVSP